MFQFDCLMTRLSTMVKCIHSICYREIENSDFNARKRIGADMYFQTAYESNACRPRIDYALEKNQFVITTQKRRNIREYSQFFKPCSW